jgi:hypothetical protein
MRKIFTLITATFFTLATIGQNFEGEVVYQLSYKSKMPNMTGAQLGSMLGTKQEYYIRNGEYKSIFNGSYCQWQLYVNRDNKLYSKTSNADTLLWNDGRINTDEIIKAEINKHVTEILGYACDELVLTCKSGVQKFYFSAKLPVDATLFASHKYGNWHAYLSKANAIPLKSVMDFEEFTIESVATEVKPGKLDKAFFDLPPMSKQ